MDKDIDRLTDLVQRSLFVEMEASGRHVHVTQAQAQTLFGHGLKEQRPLSQPGQFLAQERVTVIGPKGTLQEVAVLGPCRKQSQIEVSQTDARMLGLQAPVRLSGDVENTPSVTLRGPCGSVTADGVIVAKRHIHMSPEDARHQNVADGSFVRLKTLTQRPLIFEDVAVRVDPSFRTYVHLDYDEANACGYVKGDLGMILR